MAIPVRLVGALIFSVLAACGGKIAPDANGSTSGSASGGSGSGFGAGGAADTTPAPTSSAPPSSGAPPSSPFATSAPAAPSSGLAQPSGPPSVDDACAAICTRNGECGASQPDCNDRCTNEINGAVACSAQANAYIRCYAANLLPGCAALPPVCESAYCAFTVCAGKVVPDYCR